ncbi:MAG: NAD-dependent protein deacylase 2 [Promethearchaeota archaeon]|nr:MAG: NAD-dependent protein deacylase 2 [Candidatus Lokiarchaeota archaeon]
MLDKEKIDKAVQIIKKSDNIVVFTGAGISTESGIADFRSEDGLWSRYDPSIYANYYSFMENPSPFWEMHNSLMEDLTEANPNPAHYAIAELEEMGKVKAIITQNIDMLHQRAGSGEYQDIPIFELHGSYGTLECIKCGKEWDYREIDTTMDDYPTCDDCSGFIKPKVILFGESLPPNVMEGAMNALIKADCFILVGSSLAVTPANSLPIMAKRNNAKLIYVNKESTMMDDLADVFLKGKASNILKELVIRLKKD